MEKIYKPELLTDKSRLQEIYDLRVTAYENSPKSIYVNKEIFPQGLFDHLDNRDQTFHWIVKDNNKIIAAARLAIIDDLNEIKDLDEALDKYEIPKHRPFAYYSRLVVHHDYRKLGLVNILDKVRIDYLHENQNIKFAIAWATSDRDKALTNFGFKSFGEFNYTWGGEFREALNVCFYYKPINNISNDI
jgi:predicted GNAT family N-acyltransferase